MYRIPFFKEVHCIAIFLYDCCFGILLKWLCFSMAHTADWGCFREGCILVQGCLHSTLCPFLCKRPGSTWLLWQAACLNGSQGASLLSIHAMEAFPLAVHSTRDTLLSAPWNVATVLFPSSHSLEWGLLPWRPTEGETVNSFWLTAKKHLGSGSLPSHALKCLQPWLCDRALSHKTKVHGYWAKNSKCCLESWSELLPATDNKWVPVSGF